MRMTTALLMPFALALPAVAMPHPCEVKVAQMEKDVEGIRAAIATFERLKPSDDQRLMVENAKYKYDLELGRLKEAQARCETLVRAESPGAAPSPATPPATSSVTTAPPAPTPAPVQVQAPAAAVPVAPVAETARPAAPAPAAVIPAATTTPAAPCFTGCGKDVDCKGDRICVKGSCQDPPSR
jgi:hypothetical protein